MLTDTSNKYLIYLLTIEVFHAELVCLSKLPTVIYPLEFLTLQLISTPPPTPPPVTLLYKNGKNIET